VDRDAPSSAGLVVLLAMLVVVGDFGTFGLNALNCGLGEGKSDEAIRFCEAGLYRLPLIGIAYVLGGGVLAALVRNLSLLSAGTGIGAALGFSVWVSGDPLLLRPLMHAAIVIGVLLAVAIPLLALRDNTRRAG
jgi:hypothetical protein